MQLLGDRRRRGQIAQFAGWAQSRAREEYTGRNPTGSKNAELNNYLDFAALLEEMVATAKRFDPTD